MKTIRRRRSIVTERYESTVIRLERGSSFRFCEGCEKCRATAETPPPDLTRLTIDELLTTGEYRISRIEHGVLILCSGIQEAGPPDRCILP